MKGNAADDGISTVCQDNNWFPAGGILFDLGDWDGDSIADVASFSAPFLTLYHSGGHYDEYIDGLANLGIAPGHWDDLWWRAATLLGDIDGSGVSTFAIPDEAGMFFLKPYHPSDPWGEWRHLPEGTGRSTSSVPPSSASWPTLRIIAIPNPTRSSVRFLLPEIPGAMTSTLTIVDERGSPLLRTELPSSARHYEWSTDGIPSGSYRVIFSNGPFRATTSVLVQR